MANAKHPTNYSDAVSKSYVDDAVSGIQWLAPVTTTDELAELDDPDGSARLVQDTNVAYVKDGGKWFAFTNAGADPTGIRSPIAVGAIGHLAEIAEEAPHERDRRLGRNRHSTPRRSRNGAGALLS